MKVDIKIPALGESITQVTIGQILKTSGSSVHQDDELVEIETDKLNQMLYAPKSGKVTFTVKTGDTANIGDVIGYVEEAKEAAVKQQVAAPRTQAKQEWLEELPEKPTPTAAPAPTAAPKPEPQPQPKQQETKKPLSKLRKVMAERLLDVSRNTAMLTTFNEVDMSEIIKLREQYKELFQTKFNVKLGFMSFFVKAASSALHAFPMVNSYLVGDDQMFRSSIDIGIAIASERGLIVPTLKAADSLSFAEIEQKIDDFAKRALNATLAFEELTGAGFTITNGGVFGSMLSTPILNPPQSAILGMHKITKRAVVVNDQIAIRPIMYLALSYDHRVLDGKEAVSFLVHIKNMLEDPHRLELGV